MKNTVEQAQSFSGATAVFGMGSCYALGTFTDNFYKQAAILLAAASQMGSMQSTATVLFSLPFILCSAWAGWLADRVAKKYIVMGAKTLELLALVVGSFMLVRGHWAGILAVLFIMGLQATIFSPAINGSIPENFPTHQVPRVNSLIKLASTAAILAGMALAGVFLDARPASLGGMLPDGLIPEALLSSLGAAEGDGAAYGRAVAVVFIVAIAILGLITAFILKMIPPAQSGGKQAPFPWTGPVDSFRHAMECRKDRELFLVLLAEAFFYGVAAIAVISIANLAASLSYSNTLAGFMTAILMIGIAVGSLIAGKTTVESWRRLFAPSAAGMSAALFLVSLSPLLPAGDGINAQLCWIFGTLFLCGLCGGLYLIPLASFIQVRPAASEKGKILGVSNFMSFMAMALFGAAFQLIGLLPPNMTFAVYGILVFCFAFFFILARVRRLPGLSIKDGAASPLAWLMRALLSLRYRVRESGLDAIPLAAAPLAAEGDETTQDKSEPQKTGGGTGILILPNHPALIDPVIVYSRLAGLWPRPLSDESQMRGPLQSLAARVVRAVTIPDLERQGKKGTQGVRIGIDRIIQALRQGDNVLLYPAGRAYRSAKEVLGGNSAVSRILAELPQARVVLARSTGLWGSSFSYAGGNKPRFMKALLQGLRTLLANLFVFTPRREVSIEFVEPADLPRDGDKQRLNAYLEAFYAKAERAAMTVPRFFWQGGEAKPVTEGSGSREAPDLSDLPEDIRDRVYELIREYAELDATQKLDPGQNLRADLFMDSLALMDLATALETEFGHALPNLEGISTVGDCLAAASGRLQQGEAGTGVAVPPAWFAALADEDAEDILSVLHGKDKNAETVPAAFLQLARKAPKRVLTADRSGLRTRRQILTGALVLSRRFARLPGKRLGIMLPAAPATLAVWLAAMLAGKEPVLLNWTLGLRSMRHCIELSGITHLVTATALLERLEESGMAMSGLPVTCIAADKLAGELGLWEKIRGAALAALHCCPLPWSLPTRKVPAIAAVLFTSGSEAAPKAVPLSHENIMTNAADVAGVLKVRQSDRLLAMLPPFHSFGLLAGLVLPTASGLAAAYHPNPTESAPLVSLVRDYKLTLLGATPTFLEAMLRRAGGSGDLDSLRYAFVGAEKCPDHVYREFSACCPDAALCEGYGITECSPVVSVNRPGDVVPGSIGQPLPSVTVAIVKEDEGGALKDAYEARRCEAGESGMLLVRGPSIFSGYLSAAAQGDMPPDPFVPFEEQRWYRTGDLVSQSVDGRLFFQGRLKRFVKIGGEMISLPLMESLLQEALARRADVPDDGKPFIAVEARPGSEEAGQAEILAFSILPLNVGEINSVFRDAGLAPVFSVKRVVRLREIPLLGTGKTDYRALHMLV